MIQAARGAYPQADIAWHLLPTNWRYLPFADGVFQAIVASSVFEYLDDLGSVFREAGRVLRPGGILLFTVPNVDHIIRRIEHVLARGMRMPIILRMASLTQRTSQYARYLKVSKNRFSQGEWLLKAQEAGFTCAETTNPTQRSRLIMLMMRKTSCGGQS
jgi:SAM-dependent methyltransferase